VNFRRSELANLIKTGYPHLEMTDRGTSLVDILMAAGFPNATSTTSSR
jgi:hypothetical protein